MGDRRILKFKTLVFGILSHRVTKLLLLRDPDQANKNPDQAKLRRCIPLCSLSIEKYSYQLYLFSS
jgi:hypothetical protein